VGSTIVCLAALALLTASCSESGDERGHLWVSIYLPEAATIPSFDYRIHIGSVPATDPLANVTGTIPMPYSFEATMLAYELPAGAGDSITVTATTSRGFACQGSNAFAIPAGGLVQVSVAVVCADPIRGRP
jgi:hypothetical protein